MRQSAYNIGTRACAALLGSALALALVIALFSPNARAQQQDPQPEAQPEDPGVVIMRTVSPRIAYRGVPLEDNPIHTRATVFPARVFHDTLDSALGDALGDGELGAATGSNGIVMQATSGMLRPDMLGGAGGAGPGGASAAGSAPLGMGASVGGAVNGATGNLGNTITGALGTALQQTSRGTP